MGTVLSLLSLRNPTPCESVELAVVPSCARPTSSSGVFVLLECGRIQLWDAINNELLWDVNWEYGLIVYYLPARHILISLYCRKAAIRITELDSGNIRTIQGGTDFDQFIPSHDGSKFLMGLSSGNYIWTTLWRHDDGLREVPMQWDNHYDKAYFSHDDTRIITVATDATIRVWDIETGQRVLSFTGLNIRGLVDTHANLFAMCHKEDVQIWDLATGIIKRNITAARVTSAISISLEHVIVAHGTLHDEGRLVCWSITDGTELFNIIADAMYTSKILWSPTIGGFCTFSCFDAKVRHYNLAGQQLSCSATYGDYGDDYSSIGVSAAIPEVILM
jgi:WD40 repeat protein